MADAITITIQIPPESQALIRQIEDWPTEFPQIIKRGLDRGLSIVRGRIQEKRLSGKGPFSVGQHRLGERSGLLRRAVREEPAVVRGQVVTGSIGAFATNRGVNYALVNEYGATITGKPFLIFKTQDGKTVFTRKVVIPERAPFRTEFESQQTVQTLGQEILTEIEKTALKK